MGGSEKRAAGAAARSGSVKQSRQTRRTLHSILAPSGYEETVFVGDRGHSRGLGAVGVPERHSAAYPWRAKCRSVLGPGWEEADFPDYPAALPLRPDVR